jgi:hypothetical protein
MPPPKFNLSRTEKMGKDASRLRDEFRVRLGRMAQELAREIYPDGLPEGTKFSELEDIAGTLADEMARQLIEGQVRAQAEVCVERPPELCPACEGPARKAPSQPRELVTTRGKVAWTENMMKCPRCRRAFSPSGPGVGP